MSGGGGSTKSVTQNYSPEEAARRSAIMDQAIKLYNQQGPNPGYTGAVPVGFSQDTQQAQDWMRTAAGQAQGVTGDMAQALQFGLTGAIDLENNPYFQQAQEAALRPITQNFREQVLPGISSNAQAQGAYGGARQGIAEALAADRYMQNIADTSSKMSLDAYNSGLDASIKALGLAPSTMSAFGTPASLLSSVGAQTENLASEWENYLAAARDWDLNYGWNQLENAANIVYNGGGSQSTAKTTGGAQRNPLLGAVGGGLAGGALAGMSGGAVGGPVGMAAGAILGALFS